MQGMVGRGTESASELKKEQVSNQVKKKNPSIKCCFTEVNEIIAFTFNEAKFTSCFLTLVLTCFALLDCPTVFPLLVYY